MRHASPMRARRRAIVLRAGGQWQSPALRSIAIAFLRLSPRALRQCLVACAAVAAFWAWDTWLRFDDSADIQGEWLTANGTALVVIDAEEIHMPDSVDFKYTLDTNNKTISYTFVDLAGGGSYEFSRDRATLTITESDGSQTVFQKYSDSTDGEPRVLSADEAAALMNAGQSQENATAQGSGDSSKATGEVSAETFGEAAGDSAAQTETDRWVGICCLFGPCVR